MKKIFGVFSLIAILPVAFTSQASANSGKTDNIEFVVVSTDTYPTVVNMVATPTESILFYVTVSSVNYIASVEDLKPNNEYSARTLYSYTNYAKIHLPFEVGLTNKNFNTYYSNYTSARNLARIDLPFVVGWNTNTNI